MNTPVIEEILKLSVEERMRLVDLIWESLASELDSIPLSAAHVETIERRLEEHRRNPDATVTLEEVLEHARKE